MIKTETHMAQVRVMDDPHVLISIEELVPGMVLVAPVHDAGGRLLAPTGTTLTARHQRQMRQRGITMIAIAPQNAVALAPTSAVAIETSAAAAELVVRSQNDPFMRELTRIARTRHEQRRQNGVRAQEEHR